VLPQQGVRREVHQRSSRQMENFPVRHFRGSEKISSMLMASSSPLPTTAASWSRVVISPVPVSVSRVSTSSAATFVSFWAHLNRKRRRDRFSSAPTNISKDVARREKLTPSCHPRAFLALESVWECLREFKEFEYRCPYGGHDWQREDKPK
jgi:hypothetical protein